MINLTKTTIVVISCVFFTIFTYGAIVLYLTWPISEFSIAKSGTFGDSFGVVTSLFSGLAFAGIILTILLQRKELTESREIFRIQRFEGSFYRLLELYRKNLESVRVIARFSNDVYEGIDALSYSCKRLSEVMKQHNKYLEVENGRFVYEIQLFIAIQKNIIRQARYLGTLQNILELIERDLPTESERAPYWDIVASQITASEAKYIFYCCLVAEKDDPLRVLMHRADMIGGRIKGNNISNSLRTSYQRIHGLELPHHKTKLVTPYSRKELRALTRLAKEALKKTEETEVA